MSRSADPSLRDDVVTIPDGTPEALPLGHLEDLGGSVDPAPAPPLTRSVGPPRSRAARTGRAASPPTIVLVRTYLGYGSPKQGDAVDHGAPLGTEPIAATREMLGRDHAPLGAPGSPCRRVRPVSAIEAGPSLCGATGHPGQPPASPACSPRW